MEGIDMLAIIQEIGVVPSVVIAAVFGYLGGLFTAIVGRCIEIDKEEAQRTITDKDIKNNYDYVDWSKVPHGYDWVAVDSIEPGDCLAFAFNEKPYISQVIEDPQTWIWSNGGFIEIPGAIVGPLPPWRESLRRRPS